MKYLEETMQRDSELLCACLPACLPAEILSPKEQNGTKAEQRGKVSERKIEFKKKMGQNQAKGVEGKKKIK